MKDFSGRYPGRHYDMMHYGDTETFTVSQVQAFTCPPNDDEVRWIPEKGVSTTSVFKSELAAKDYLIGAALREKGKLTVRLAAVEEFLEGRR